MASVWGKMSTVFDPVLGKAIILPNAAQWTRIPKCHYHTVTLVEHQQADTQPLLPVCHPVGLEQNLLHGHAASTLFVCNELHKAK